MKKNTRCPICRKISCGDDSHTVTKYLGPERRLGDRQKVILLQVFDMISLDNLQVFEIKALLNCLVDEHIKESEQ